MSVKMRIKSIKTKLMIFVGIPVVILVTLFLAKSYQERSAELIEGRTLALEQRYYQVLNLIHSQARISYALAAWVATMPEVSERFAKRDREGLQQLILPPYLSMRKELNLKQFQFHIPPATSFLRLHKIDKYGDDLSGFRNTVVEANKEKKPKIGLEKGVAGTGIRAVAPVSFEGKHVGTVEFGARLNDKLIMNLKEKYGFNISVVVPDGNEYRFQAKTHKMKILPKSYPILNKVMKSGRMEIRRITKNNKELVTFFGPLRDFSGKVVGVIAMPDDVTTKMTQIKRSLFLYIGVGLLIVLIVLSVVYLTMEMLINRPLKEMQNVFGKAEKGDLSDTLKIRRDDELGEVGTSFNAFLGETRRMFKEIGTSSDTLDYSATELTSISKQMAAGAEETSGRSNTVAVAAEEMSANMISVAAAVEEASTNVGMVAASTEEMTSVINEISRNTEKARAITGEAVSEARSASEKVDELGKAANKIGKVTETITEISKQTNLLALNATIEAARAGEADKGFAVVANEIKELARQTADATGEIKEKIAGIQNSTEGTVTQIEQISKVVNDVNEVVSTIATAIEEQSVTTREISNNVVQASQGIQEVTENVAQSSTVSQEIARDIAEVNQAANEMNNNSSQVNMSAEELSKLAEQLKEMVGRFKV